MSQYRELVDLVSARVKVPLDDTTVASVLLILESHHLLREWPAGESVEHYHERVQRTYAAALRAITGEAEG